MEFTLEDVKRHSFTLKQKKKLYTRKKSRAAFDLYQMKAQGRGETIERMVAEKLASEYEHIVSSTQTKSNHPYDIDVLLDCGRHLKVEVKSSLYVDNSKYPYFQFQNVHIDNFDYCIFVAVTPVGLRAFWASYSDLRRNTSLGEWGRDGCSDRQILGVRFRFKDDWSGPYPTWLRHMEDFPF